MRTVVRDVVLVFSSTCSGTFAPSNAHDGFNACHQFGSYLIRAILLALFDLVELLLDIDGRAAPNLRLDSGMSLLAVMGLMVKGTNYAYYVD